MRGRPLPFPATANSVDISIVIPSYNRGSRVTEAIQKCLSLAPAPREIIIVDDHSDSDAERMLRELEHGIVKYIRLPENEGQASARSIGMATARGKYLISLDDDSWFLENDTLQRVWNRLEALPTCGILALRGFSPGIPIEPSVDKLSLVADHITCGAAYRADVMQKTGYHLAFLRYEGEESDLSIKVIDAGFDIVLDESIRFFHDYNPATRSSTTLANVRRLAVRNDLLRAWIYFPVDLAIALTLWRSVSHCIWGIRQNAIGATLRGYAGFFAFFAEAVRHRRPVQRSAALKYLTLRRRPRPLQHEE